MWGGSGRGFELPSLLLISLAGVIISIYLTITHISAVPLVCTIGGPVNCVAVTHSAYSVIPSTSIPISIMGIVWFVVSGGLALTRFHAVHLAWAGIGLLVVLYLVFVEIVLLRQVCEWCTAVHVLVLLTFVLALRRLQNALT